MALTVGAELVGTPEPEASSADGITAPLGNSTFRRIWLASLLSNLGTLIQGVAVGWAMTLMTSSADKVALVQTALGMPVMLVAMLAGAFADVHDRRVVALVSLAIALAGADGTEEAVFGENPHELIVPEEVGDDFFGGKNLVVCNFDSAAA